MTVSDAIVILETAFPERSVFLCVSARSYGPVPYSPRHRKVDYTVSILPGLDGSKCQQFTGTSISHCVEMATRNADHRPLADVDEQTSDIDVVSLTNNPV